MKKLLIITNLFWVCVIVLPSFVQPGNTNPANTSSYHLLDASLVKMMSQSYKDNYIYTYLKKRTTFEDKTNGVRNTEDSRTIWFSKEKLTQFLNDMDMEANTHNNSSVSGIRFYYIKYPKGVDWSKYKYFTDPSMKMPTQYQERHSLILVPTYLDNSTGYHTDFDPRQVDATGKFKDMGTVMDELIAKESIPLAPPLIRELNKKYDKKDDGKNNFLPTNINYPGRNPVSDQCKISIVSADDSGSDPSIINGGGIIPPYGVGGPPALMIKTKAGGSINSQASMNNIIDVPCSGATLMLYIDGYKKCGKYERSAIDIAVPKN